MKNYRILGIVLASIFGASYGFFFTQYVFGGEAIQPGAIYYVKSIKVVEGRHAICDCGEVKVWCWADEYKIGDGIVFETRESNSTK